MDSAGGMIGVFGSWSDAGGVCCVPSGIPPYVGIPIVSHILRKLKLSLPP